MSSTDTFLGIGKLWDDVNDDDYVDDDVDDDVGDDDYDDFASETREWPPSAYQE